MALFFPNSFFLYFIYFLSLYWFIETILYNLSIFIFQGFKLEPINLKKIIKLLKDPFSVSIINMFQKFQDIKI